jgi:hypothetical protein
MKLKELLEKLLREHKQNIVDYEDCRFVGNNCFFDADGQSNYYRAYKNMEERKDLQSIAQFFLENCPNEAVRLMIAENGNCNEICNRSIHVRAEYFTELLSIEDLTKEQLNQQLMYNGTLLGGITYLNPELIPLALKKRCDPNVRDDSDWGNTPLIESIALDAKESAMELITQCENLGIPINLDIPSVFNGNTPLILCIAKGHARKNCMPNFKLTKFLLEHGADPNKPDKEGFTPLHYAYMRRDIPTIDLLTRYGANPNIRNNNGETAVEMLKHDHLFCQNKLRKITNADKSRQDDCCSIPSWGFFFADEQKLLSQPQKFPLLQCCNFFSAPYTPSAKEEYKAVYNVH